MSFLISDALAAAPAAGASPMTDSLMSFLLPVFMLVVFYFLLIRPQAKQRKEHQKLINALTKGDEVVTLGGIAGRVADLGDNFVLLEIAEGVQVKVRRPAVEAVLPKGSLKDL
ncbi:preprotein translocase subunit YajC [uncultured Thiodictyon sp.]|uniref:preprotein translocase subunit YajC n=1 Tax=uncultured Thiodictyon sp. TaxID=1846217 RepID=UPI0025EB2C63|nr:preprotein translocase subunit YajC [uncultured Thiodictyon sp.]